MQYSSNTEVFALDLWMPRLLAACLKPFLATMFQGYHWILELTPKHYDFTEVGEACES